jgi:hypothetical protein
MAGEYDDGQQADGGNESFDPGALIAEVREKHGVNLLTEDALNKRLAKEKSKQDAMRADLDAVKTQYEETQSELQKYLDKGKTDEQRRAEETLKLEKQAKAYREQLAQEQARSAELQRGIKERDLNAKLGSLLGDKAKNLNRATLIARTELHGLDLDDDGSLVFTDPASEIPYTGDEAVKHISSWWEKQTDLHRANGGSGPPPANPKPTGDNSRPYGELTDEERFARRHAGG